MCTDGVNPFAHNKVTYSMWPIMLTLLNLPRKSRNRFGSIMLQGIIPGNGTKEMYNINPYIDIMVLSVYLMPTKKPHLDVRLPSFFMFSTTLGLEKSCR